MNIFILDENVEKSAQYHCDKHCVKMILEEAQILSSVHHVLDPKPDIPYKLTHKNHPCSIWARTSEENYLYLIFHGYFLCREYTYRYGKVHKCQPYYCWFIDNIPANFPYSGQTPFAQAMPDKYKNENAVQAYRDYYNGEKRHIFNWKNRKIPYWVEKGEKQNVN